MFGTSLAFHITYKTKKGRIGLDKLRFLLQIKVVEAQTKKHRITFTQIARSLQLDLKLNTDVGFYIIMFSFLVGSDFWPINDNVKFLEVFKK